MRDAFGVERPDLVSKSGPLFGARRTLEASNDVKAAVPPAKQRAKIKSQWANAKTDSGSGQSGVGGPALIGSSLDDVSKGLPGTSDVHANAPIDRSEYRKQRQRDRRLRHLRTGAEPVGKAMGTPTTNRGAASPTFKPVEPPKPDIVGIKGKLAPLKQAMVASTKIK